MFGVCVLLLIATVLPRELRAAAAETWEVAGVTYSNVRVGEVTRGSVTIFHAGGITQLELAKLPPALQARFGFDPTAAQRWQQESAIALAASSETQRRNEEQRDAAGRRAARTRAASATPDVTGPVAVYPAVDLRPVYRQHGLYLRDQGRRPSCSVFAIVSALEYEIARRQGHADPLSEDYLIWATRKLQADIPIDDGFHFEEVISALQSYGIPRHQTMPNTFGKKMEDIEPTPAALSEAPALRSVIPVWIRADDPKLLERIVTRLNQQTPIVLGLRWPHWRALEHTALLSDQAPLEGAGHAVTLIGYKCPENGGPEDIVFMFRNSWGVRWGAGGCGYVTTGYLRQQIITAFYLTLPDAPALAATTP